ncbi:serine hydrolase domain-containing protein [Halobellus limi]|jgi:CubicO group peptidase (beta-lactamase class C family)|uniref:Class A beta-lactamase-related serine hydrolase n=1 Tax=Halobellus limi TaxID=699433 RepID=A0A1H6BTD9_9EURY|nr:serine hydrolase domain-containing protein [Halobellus limi]QCC49492.1 class A beta-lactamase-related serine hydrolase [Halobellus limi]SEG63910.1 CubicO group peptidase, beta-lactamase class C family [Halobellus limi]
MTQPQRSTATTEVDRTTRRSFLACLGTLGFGLGNLGTVAGRTSATINSPVTEVQQHKSPFGDPDELEAFVDDVIADRIGETTPGATVAIVSGGSPVLTKGYGVADTEAGNPVRADDTAFRVGSVGKLVTYTAVMQGVERGVLDLDADVNTYLDDSPVTIPDTYNEPVTLRHLGTHTAGFESTLDPEIVADSDALDSLETVLAEQQPPRIRRPGELVGYSNYGAALAGHVVAEAHDTTFTEYVHSEVFEPLGMSHSTFAQPVPNNHPGNLARPHDSNNASFTVADDVYINMQPAGSLTATATDMAAFMLAHLGTGAVSGTRILDTKTTERMHSRHHVRHPTVTNWRYGFHEYGSPDANLLAHSGATVNFTSHLLLAPDHGVGIFVAYNSKPSELPAAVVDEIVAEYGLQPAPATPPPTSEPGMRERAETVAGEYSLSSLPASGPLQVADQLAHLSVEPGDGNRLRTSTLDGDTREWVETDPYVYHELGGHDVLAFEVTDGGVEVLNMSSVPTGVYQPVPLQDRQLVTAGLLGTAISGFGLSLAARGAHSALRQWQRGRTRNKPEEDSK